MKILIVGAHTVGRYAAKKIIESENNVVGIFTLDEEKRQAKCGFYSFYNEASENSIPWRKVSNINNEEIVNEIKSLDPDLIFVLGWSQIIKDEVLSIPKFGVVGAHTSVLPKNRGRAPLNWAIINDEETAGISMFYLEPGVDTGMIINQKEFSICPKDNIRTLYNKAELALGKMVEDFLKEKPLPEGRPQNDEKATYVPKRRPSDGLIDWSEGTDEIYNKIRALTKPYPGAFFYWKRGKILVWDSESGKNGSAKAENGEVLDVSSEGILVKTGNGAILLKRLQNEESPSMWGEDFAREFGVESGMIFGKPEDFPEVVEYYFLDGKLGTRSFPTNLKRNERGNLKIKLVNHKKKSVHLNFTLNLDGKNVEEKEFELEPHKEGIVQFNFSFSEEGRHKVRVIGVQDGSEKRQDYLSVVVQ